MTPLPSRPERWLRAALGDTASAPAIIGDLREEYLPQRPGLRRSLGYTMACASVALRYAPATMADAVGVETSHTWARLSRARLYSVSVVMTLAVGTAIAGTLFTVAYGALVRPLPYRDPAALVMWGQSPLTGQGVGSINSAAPANFLDLRRSAQDVADVAAYRLEQRTALTPPGASRVLTNAVSGAFFDVLGVSALAGRLIAESDDSAGVEPVVVIGERLWRRDFAADRSVIGQSVSLDTRPHRIVGVLPQSVAWPGDPQMWVPFQWDAAAAAVRGRRNIEGLARLHGGIGTDAATQALRARFAAFSVNHPKDNATTTVSVMPIRTWLLGRSIPNNTLIPLLTALAAVMLGLAWINIATLVLARREAYTADLALRQVLGASPGRQRLSRVAEGTLLSISGCVAGGLLAGWAIPLVIDRFGTSIPRAATIHPDATTLVACGLVALVSAMVIASALRPRRKLTTADLGQRTSTRRSRVRHHLVAAEVGLAGALAYGAILVGAMVASLARVDMGVPLDNAMTFGVGIPGERYQSPAAIGNFHASAATRIGSLPGVLAVGATSRAPFSGGTNGPASNADDSSKTQPIVEWRVVTPGFFEAVGLPVVAGQTFPASSDGQRRIVISESLATAFFGNTRSTGGRVRLDEGAPYSVIGVVPDIRDFGPARPGRPTLYLSHGSEPGFASLTDLTYVIRTSTSSADLLPAIRQRIAEVDPEVPIRSVATLSELAERAIGVNRTSASLALTSLTIVALLLGAIGVYGVAAFAVVQRTREVGVRLALGETPAGIARLLLVDGLRLLRVGGLVAIAGGWWIHKLVQATLIADHRPTTGVVTLVVAIVLAGTVVLAYALPARRAARMSPVDALRAD